jgi:trimethylamine--corrinoid protein Co-methyltransferase
MAEQTPFAPEVPAFRALSEEKLIAIHEASLEVLQRTGYHTPVAEARRLALAGGGRVEGERVFITPDMVSQALKSVRPVKLYNRRGELSPVVTPGRVTFGTIADTFYVSDPYTRTVRPFLKEDQGWLATVIDALPGIDYVQCVGQAHDVQEALQTQVAFAQTVRHTAKPLLVYPYDRAGLLDILEITTAIAGGEKAFQEKPFMMCAAVPAAPLSGTDYSLELLLTCAERDVPVLSYCCPAIGGNSPASISATMVLSNADWLANLVFHQLKKPGAPFCTAGFTVQLMDMRTTLWSYCAPETLAAYAAVSELAHWYGLPAFGLEMTCDIPQLNAQAGAEMMAQCQQAFLSGVEMVHNAGIYGAGKLCGAEAVILADEIIAYTRATNKPVEIEPSQLTQAIEMIDEVGPLGEYVSHPDTLARFRSFWYPRMFDRSMFDPQGKDLGSNLHTRLNERARQLIETHQPTPLPVDLLGEIESIEAGWMARTQNS